MNNVETYNQKQADFYLPAIIIKTIILILIITHTVKSICQPADGYIQEGIYNKF